MRTKQHTSLRRALAKTLAATSAALFVLTAVSAAFAPAATAATSGTWGSGGVVTTNSAVTARYDNVGNSKENTVARTPDTVLPHTGGKTYKDLDQTTFLATQKDFANLSVSVSQTKDLVNQTIMVQLSGVIPNAVNGGNGRFYQIVQCWGAPGQNGKPDPNAGPDPETCVTGGLASDLTLDNSLSQTDRGLAKGGDWVYKDKDQVALNTPPFRAVDGTVPMSGGRPTRGTDNPYFNVQTTNTVLVAPSTATTVKREFEVQTTTESQGLGCGRKADAASVSRCWLVVLPGAGEGSSLGASSWAHRVQIALDFADIGGVCASGQKRTLLSGSEVLSTAMASWIPALCDKQNTAVGYVALGDVQVRREMDSGSRNAGLVARPGTAQAFNAPIAVAGTVIAYRWDQRNGGGPLQNIKLNPRLVAKLLTQSYVYATDAISGSQIYEKSWWDVRAPRFKDVLPDQIPDDPEFTTLNPDVSTPNQVSDLVASLTQSDSMQVVWQWILSDKQAASFLHGCPDPNGKVINPFFSTRTYEGCEADRVALDAAADAKIKATISPKEFVYQPAVYPPTTANFPQPGWYERDSKYSANGEIYERGLTIADLHPRLNALSDVGRSIGRGVYPRNSIWCPSGTDDSCLPFPGKWKSDAAPAYYGSRAIMGITDSVTAARFGLQTVKLCATEDTKGEKCVGADDASLTAAAKAFVPDGAALNNSLLVGGKPDYASGAYPLTLPVYASIAKTGLKQTDARTYADVFDWMSTTGQTPGTAPGQLVPGYAPLTPNLLALTRTAITDLRAYTEPPKTVTTPNAPPPPVNAQAPAPAAAAPPKPLKPVAPPTKAAVSAAQQAPAEQQSTGAVANPAAVAKVGTTPVTEQGFPQFGLVGGLAGAVLTGLAAPLVGGPRRRITE